jgi:hypothetical protein
METETKRTLPIDAHLVAIDQTEYWNIPDHMEHIEKILGVYLYDANEHTYLCEMQPSYWLYPVDNVVVFRDSADDEVQDDVDQVVRSNGDDGIYMHVIDIEMLIEREPEHHRHPDTGDVIVSYDDCPYDEQIESYIEHFQGNAAF